MMAPTHPVSRRDFISKLPLLSGSTNLSTYSSCSLSIILASISLTSSSKTSRRMHLPIWSVRLWFLSWGRPFEEIFATHSEKLLHCSSDGSFLLNLFRNAASRRPLAMSLIICLRFQRQSPKSLEADLSPAACWTFSAACLSPRPDSLRKMVEHHI